MTPEDLEREYERYQRGDFTPGERRALAVVASERGWDYAKQHAVLILDQARLIHGEDLEKVR